MASLDNLDGAVQIADVTTGEITTVADLGLPAYSGDDCGTLGNVVDWAPDDSAVLVSAPTAAFDGTQTIAAFRVDGSRAHTLWQHTAQGFDPTHVAARWLADGTVTIVSAATGDLTVEHGDPWNAFPADTRVLPRPTPDDVESMSISPDGQLTAIAHLSSDHGVRTPTSTASVLVMDNELGTARTVSEHEATTDISFAPDGHHVTFGTWVTLGNPKQLVITATDGSGEQTLPNLSDYVMHASWSTDGTAVLAGARSLQRFDLTDGSTTTLIAPDPPPDPTDTANDQPPAATRNTSPPAQATTAEHAKHGKATPHPARALLEGPGSSSTSIRTRCGMRSFEPAGVLHLVLRSTKSRRGNASEERWMSSPGWTR